MARGRDPARAGSESPAASATSEASGVTASTKSLPTASSSGPRRCTGMHCRRAPSGKRTEVQTRPEQLGPQHRPLGGRRQYRVPQLGEHGGSLPGIGMGPPLCPKGFRTAGRCSGSRPGAAGWRRCAPRASEPPTAVVGRAAAPSRTCVWYSSTGVQGAELGDHHVQLVIAQRREQLTPRQQQAGQRLCLVTVPARVRCQHHRFRTRDVVLGKNFDSAERGSAGDAPFAAQNRGHQVAVAAAHGLCPWRQPAERRYMQAWDLAAGIGRYRWRRGDGRRSPPD